MQCGLMSNYFDHLFFDEVVFVVRHTAVSCMSAYTANTSVLASAALCVMICIVCHENISGD